MQVVCVTFGDSSRVGLSWQRRWDGNVASFCGFMSIAVASNTCGRDGRGEAADENEHDNGEDKSLPMTMEMRVLPFMTQATVVETLAALFG